MPYAVEQKRYTNGLIVSQIREVNVGAKNQSASYPYFDFSVDVFETLEEAQQFKQTGVGTKIAIYI